MTRIGFVTCVELGLACLEEIEGLGGRLHLLVTLDDTVARRKSGRIFLDDYAQRNGTPLIKTKNINDADCFAQLREAALDYLLIVIGSSSKSSIPRSFPLSGAASTACTGLPVGRGRGAHSLDDPQGPARKWRHRLRDQRRCG